MATHVKVLSNRIAVFLGSGHSTTIIITSVLITLMVFFYIFTLGSYLSVEIYSLKNRVTYADNFQYYLTSYQFDKIVICIAASACLLLILRKKIELVAALVYAIASCVAIFTNSSLLLAVMALLSFPWLVGILLFSRYIAKSYPAHRIDNELTGNYIALTAIFLGLQSLVLSIILILIPNSNSLQIHNYAYFIYILFSSASPFLIAVLVFCVPTKIVIDELANFISSVSKKTIGSLSRIDIQQYKMASRSVYILLFLIVILSIVFAAIPHTPSVNKDNQQIGTDTDAYVSWETLLMDSNNTLQFLNNSFAKIGGGDRPISVLSFLGLAIISGGDIFYVTDRLPMVLGPLLVLAIFFLSRELTSNDLISLLAAFLTAVSLQMMVGLFAGYYSNWFAVIIGYSCIIFMFRYLKKRVKANLFMFSSLLIVLLFSHAYTWTIFVLVMGIFLGVVAKLKYFRRKSAAVLFVVILISVATDLTRVELTGSRGAFESDTSVALTQSAGPHQFGARWSNLTETIWTYYGGLMSNFIIYSLAIYWLVRANKKEVNSIFLMTFLSIGILPLVFSGWVIQSRVLYDIPFQIPAAIGITFIRNLSFGSKLIVPAYVWLIAVSFWAVTNLTL